MTLNDLFSGGGAVGVLLVALTLIEIAPIKINPWSKIGKAIGKCVNGDVIEKLDETRKTLDDHTPGNCKGAFRRIHNARRTCGSGCGPSGSCGGDCKAFRSHLLSAGVRLFHRPQTTERVCAQPGSIPAIQSGQKTRQRFPTGVSYSA